ncbi:MAG: hypothetical protein GX783_05125 [Clostridiales bacterium]|nr:hypothetical protein [Clostridiales bacterium]
MLHKYKVALVGAVDPVRSIAFPCCQTQTHAKQTKHEDSFQSKHSDGSRASKLGYGITQIHYRKEG